MKGDITDLAVSSNNALVASASNDFSIRVVRTWFTKQMILNHFISLLSKILLYVAVALTRWIAYICSAGTCGSRYCYCIQPQT